MTQEERIELLRKVAEVSPKEMGAYVICGSSSSPGVKFSRDNGQAFAVLTVDDDIFDAEAIIAMLDAMEGAGWAAYAGSEADDNGVRIPGYYCCCYDTNDCESLECKGETRAEAVARAFVEVFEVKP